MALFKQVKKMLKRIMPLREAAFLRDKDKLRSQLEKQQKTISTLAKTLQSQNAQTISFEKKLDSQKAEIQMLRNELLKLNKDIRRSAWGNYKLSG